MLVDLVSIHAPTKGATSSSPPHSAHYQFQSTHPRRVRPLFLYTLLPFPSFNPRTHEGCDGDAKKERPGYNVSIHAPTKGATAGAEHRLVTWLVSIHAPTKGATFQAANDADRQRVSIHAPTKGATLVTRD